MLKVGLNMQQRVYINYLCGAIRCNIPYSVERKLAGGFLDFPYQPLLLATLSIFITTNM